MDPETERHMAALLLEEAARLKRDAEISGVSAYLAKPLVRSRPSSTFLTATVRSVQQANRMAEINEMWARRNLELENQKSEMRHVSRGRNHRDMDDAAGSRGRHDQAHGRDRGQREKRGRTAMDAGEEKDENRKRLRTRDASAERSPHSLDERERWHSDADGQERHRRKTRKEEDHLEVTERESKKQRQRSSAMTSVLTDRGQVSHGAHQSTWDSHGARRGHMARASETEVAGRAADVAAEPGKRKRSYHEESDEEHDEGRENSINAGQSAEEGLDDEGIQQFLQSRVKRGRGAIGSRIDEPGPYLPPPEREDLGEGPPNTSARERLVSHATCQQPAGPEDRGSDDVERVGEVPKFSRKNKRKHSGGTSGESGEERKERRKKKKRGKKGRGGSRSTVLEEDGSAFKKKAKRRRERESSGSSEEDSGRERSEERRRRKRHRKRSESSEEEGELSNEVKRVKHRK